MRFISGPLLMCAAAAALTSTAAASTDKHNVMVVSESFAVSYVPSIIRQMDIACQLRADGHDVTVVSLHHPVNPQQLPCDLNAAGIQAISQPSSAELSQMIEQNQYDVAISSMWMWSTVNAGEQVAALLQQHSPTTKLVLMSEDDAVARQEQMEALIDLDYTELQSLYPHLTDSVYTRVHNLFSAADLVVNVNHNDEMNMVADYQQSHVSHMTFPWTHQLLSHNLLAHSPPSFQQRTGVAFVGFGDNPTNRLALHHYFKHIYPLLDVQAQQQPHYIIGATPSDNYASLKAIISEYDTFWTSALDNVDFVGDLSAEKMVQKLQSSLVLVVPSVVESGVNTKALLSMSVGLPIVSTSAGLNGYDASESFGIQAYDDVAAFASQVSTLCSTESAWTSQSRAGLQMSKHITSVDATQQNVHRLMSAVESSGQQSIQSKHRYNVQALESMQKHNKYSLYDGSGGTAPPTGNDVSGTTCGAGLTQCGPNCFPAGQTLTDGNGKPFCYTCPNGSTLISTSGPCSGQSVSTGTTTCGAGLTPCGDACYQYCVAQTNANNKSFYYTCTANILGNQFDKPSFCT